MELVVALTIGTLFAAGTFMILRPRGFPVVQGLILLSHGINILLVAMGRVRLGSAPIMATNPVQPADPLAQALVLTAIVISFAMTALLLAIALRTHAATGSDHVDGNEPPDGPP